ncbi:MAG TPA: hypothetical protein VFA50_10975 [Stellaceae bacterium]|nr:hypothetical protein [Stellaceae bacterium]
MLRNFFAAPDFLSLLRFWEDSRRGAAVAQWSGDRALIPPDLLPDLVIAERDEEVVYRYCGEECVRRFGGDPTGRPVYEALRGAYRRYVGSLIEDVLRRAAPLFSSSIFQHNGAVAVTGRLFAPFIRPGSAAPSIIMGIHLFRGDEFPLRAVGDSGVIDETQRLLISGVPELCARLEDARRYHQLARIARHEPSAGEWDDIARRLSRGALVPLETFRDAG